MFHKYMFQKPKMFQMKISKDSKFKSDWIEQAKIASWYIEDCTGKIVKISHLVQIFGLAQFLGSMNASMTHWATFTCKTYKSSTLS